MNCRICDVALVEGAVFCGGCGSSTAVDPESWRHAVSRDARLSDTTVMTSRAGISARHAARDRQPKVASGPVPDPLSATSAPVSRESTSNCVLSEGNTGDRDGGCDAHSTPRPEWDLRADPSQSERSHKTGWWNRREASRDSAHNRALPPDSRPIRLQFSTGDESTLTGTALIGRRPLAQPGEIVDHVITIVDPARTVSKTHLEVGRHDGDLWVCDRFSVNGTVITDAEGITRSLEPGRRYLARRGATVVFGEQSFTID